MAKQRGIIRLSGSIGDVTFVEGKYGAIAKAKSSLTKERIMTDPCFQGTRETMSEWGKASKCGAALRKALESLLLRIKDGSIHWRLNQLFLAIKEADLLNMRGERNLAAAFANDASLVGMLRGFEFNKQMHLSRLLACRPEVDILAGTFRLEGLDAREHIQFPSGATHAFITGAWVRMNFENLSYEFSAAEPAVIAWNSPRQDVVMQPPMAPYGEGVTCFVLRVGFAQVVNGRYFPFEGGRSNGMSIVTSTSSVSGI